MCHADHWFFGADGRLLATLEGVVGVGTPSAQPAGGDARMTATAETVTGGVAIIGMACLFPGAGDVDAYWRNILGKVDSTSDPPPESWDPDVYYDPEFADHDRTYCQRGGYLGDAGDVRPAALRHPAGLGRRRARPVAGAAGRPRGAARRRRHRAARRGARAHRGDPRQGHLPQRRQRDRGPARARRRPDDRPAAAAAPRALRGGPRGRCAAELQAVAAAARTRDGPGPDPEHHRRTDRQPARSDGTRVHGRRRLRVVAGRGPACRATGCWPATATWRSPAAPRSGCRWRR